MPGPLAALLIVLCVVAAVWDWQWRRIPNWLTLPVAAVGFAAQGVLFGATGLKAAAAGFGLACLITIPLFALRALGGGDVKLMAASGVLLGATHFGVLFVINAIAGGVVAAAYALAKGRLGATLRNVGAILGSAGRGRVPAADNPELDIAHPRALTIPRGAIYSLCALLLWAFGQFQPE
ncbi:MAG: A24 family peptidase [Bryobacteraceae bacterium]